MEQKAGSTFSREGNRPEMSGLSGCPRAGSQVAPPGHKPHGVLGRSPSASGCSLGSRSLLQPVRFHRHPVRYGRF